MVLSPWMRKTEQTGKELLEFRMRRKLWIANFTKVVFLYANSTLKKNTIYRDA